MSNRKPTWKDSKPCPEDQREAARRAYEELRDNLFNQPACESPGHEPETRELPDLISFTCEICGSSVTLTEGEQQLYAGQGIEPPKLCKDCRRARKDEASEAIGEGESGGVGGPFTL